MRKAYSIYSPPFEATSGGIRVLYGLYGWLLVKGEIAYINGKFENPEHCIAIYPEIVRGNPLGADTVVRYVMQTPGVMKLYGVPGPTKYDPKDKIFVFSKIYDTFGVDEDHLMFLPILNLHLFKDYKKERKKTCYLVGKGDNQFKHPKDSIKLNRKVATDQKALADLLNKCHTFYCYDRLTAMHEIARLCGCRVKYYGDFSKDDLKLYEPGMNGFTFKDEDDVKLDSDDFREHYKEMVKLMGSKIDRFIEITQK